MTRMVAWGLSVLLSGCGIVVWTLIAIGRQHDPDVRVPLRD